MKLFSIFSFGSKKNEPCKDKRKQELAKFADDYIGWEAAFSTAALIRTGTPPEEMLEKISTLLKDLNSGEIRCLYWRLRILYETWIEKLLAGFTDAELDEAIDAAHRRREGYEASLARKPLRPDYTTMRQDTKDSPEDAKMNSDRRLL